MTERRKLARRKTSTKRAPASQRRVARRAAPRPKAKRPAQGKAASRRGAPRRATKGRSRPTKYAASRRPATKGATKGSARGRTASKRRAPALVAGLDRPAVDLTQPTPPSKLAAARRRHTLEKKEAREVPREEKTRTADLPAPGHHSARFAGVRDELKD